MIGAFFIGTVSYTHLDVYKRQVQLVRQLLGLFLVETPERPRALAGECRHGVERDGNRAGEYLPGHQATSLSAV